MLRATAAPDAIAVEANALETFTVIWLFAVHAGDGCNARADKRSCGRPSWKNASKLPSAVTV